MRETQYVRKNGTEISVPYEGSFLISYMPVTLNLFQKKKIFDLSSADSGAGKIVQIRKSYPPFHLNNADSEGVPNSDKHTDNLSLDSNSDSACHTHHVVCRCFGAR